MSSYSDESLAKLRASVDLIGREITQLPSTPAFQAAWTDLVTVLALGSAPETRSCHVCRGIGMRAASRCGHCWAALPALPPSSETAAQGAES